MPPNFSQVLKQSGKVRLTTDDEVKHFRELVDAGASGLPTATSTPEDLDCLAEALVDLLQSAAKAVGHPIRKGTRSASWWTEECAQAAAGYRVITRLYPGGFNRDVQLAKQDFPHVVRRATRQYWHKLIDCFTDAAQPSKQCDGSQPQGPSNLHLYKSEMQCMRHRPTRRTRFVGLLSNAEPQQATYPILGYP
ncbi:hypothetical protein E5D57_013329 [Metarhizium anisopliae]|nr:hypothetical protein E5D57_013329 [Metarhizium anisopliae]